MTPAPALTFTWLTCAEHGGRDGTILSFTHVVLSRPATSIIAPGSCLCWVPGADHSNAVPCAGEHTPGKDDTMGLCSALKPP